MSENRAESDNELVDWTVAWLRARLPSAWQVVQRSEPTQDAADGGRADPVVEVRTPNVYSSIAVEAKRALAPRDVERLLGGVGRILRELSPHVPILVVAPWLSSRTRELLSAEGLNYLDQTGNASIRLDNPALFIETQGAARDPSPAPPSKARVRGPKAARLVRTLVDVYPPYGVREVADACGLAPGYVSRLLDALDQEALVERSRRGRVIDTDVPGLLRRWAETYDIFKTNRTATFVAPRRGAEALAALPRTGGRVRTAVTGSFAAVRFAPVAAPSLLAVYADDVNAVAGELDLLPADHGANVVLLRPFDPIVWERTIIDDAHQYVAPSQAAVDCLTGTGRMPAEGEALVAWMVENEQEWRAESLNDTTRTPA